METATWLSVKQASEYSRLSRSFLQKNRAGQHGFTIPFVKIGKRVLYNRIDLDTFLRNPVSN